MDKLNLASYQQVNKSFTKRMVYRAGVDCGFCAEMNYMVDAMLYCLVHHIKFQLYSKDANFGTGVGWAEYFLPFCEEVHENFHRKYNYHKLPSWLNILRICRSQKSLGPVAWKIKKTIKTFIGRIVAYRTYGERILFAQDVPQNPVRWCYIPELGIDGDYLSTFNLLARMVWRLQPEILNKEETYKMNLSLPPIYSGAQIRGGDKASETKLIDGKTHIEKLNLHDDDSLFILTDDYRLFLQAIEDFPKLKLSTLCQEDEKGYYHKLFCQKDFQSKKEAITRLIVSVDLLLSSSSFVGSITTGPSVFILKLRYKESKVQAVDCSKQELPAALQLPLRARAIISSKHPLKLTASNPNFTVSAQIIINSINIKSKNMFKKLILTIACSLILPAIKAQTGSLPVIFIETQNHQPITSKTVYVPGEYFIVDESNPDNNLGSAENPMALEIRGRGHSSWKGIKKPYKIKLGDKTPLLGMNKHKHWALLKFYEPTVVGMRLGEIMGMDWTPSTRPVEVVLNGDYIGLYLLTETNRIGKNRLNIYEQPNWNEDESSIPYGWLVEVDNYYEPNSISIIENNKWNMRITYHSPDSLSSAQKAWLQNEFEDINDAIYDVDKENSHWEQMIDVDAISRYFIIQEVLDNSDGFHGSFYLHKDWTDDARWVAGPLWDLSCNQRQKTDYTFKMTTSYGFTPHWIGELIKDEDFCRAVREVWNEFYPYEILAWMEYIDEHLLLCGEAYEQDKIRWNYTNQETLEERVERLKSSLLANIEWFNNHLPGNVNSCVGDIVKEIANVEYINLTGIRSSEPWNGINIKVTTYDDGSVITSKIFIKQ